MNLFSPLLFLKVTMFHELIELKEKKKKILVTQAKIFRKLIREVRKLVLCFRSYLKAEHHVCLHESYEAFKKIFLCKCLLVINFIYISVYM